MVKSTADQSKTCNRKKSETSDKSICSAGFSDGRSPSSGQAGAQADLFGAPVAPALPLARQVSPLIARRAMAETLCGMLDELATRYAHIADTNGLPMPATYGRKFGGLQPSASLNISLANRLTVLLDGIGSPVYEHHWKSSVTLLGLEDYQLRASERHTSDNDYGGEQLDGWRTPAAQPAGGKKPETTLKNLKKKNDPQVRLEDQVKLVGWHTPIANDSTEKKYTRDDGDPEKPRPTNLGLITGWPTPIGQQANDSPETYFARNKGKKTVTDLQVAAKMAGWATPQASSGGPEPEGKTGRKLSTMAGWATPSARDYKSESATEEFNQERDSHTRGKPLSYQATLAGWGTPRSPTNNGIGSPKRAKNARARLEDQVHGIESNSSPVQTENTGQLNPDFSRWLQGYPDAWERCADMAIR